MKAYQEMPTCVPIVDASTPLHISTIYGMSGGGTQPKPHAPTKPPKPPKKKK